MKNKIILLGTGCAIPNKDRNAPGTLIEFSDGTLLLFDIGSGVTKKLLDFKFQVTNLNYIFLSHFHVDHTSDLMYFLKANWMLKRKKVLKIIGPRGLQKFLDNLFIVYDYLREKIDFLELHELKDGDKLSFDEDFLISAVKVPHDEHSLAFLISKNNYKIVYSGDTGYSENLIRLATNVDILIHECSILDKDARKGHVTPSELASISLRSNVKQLILTHFYPTCDSHLEEIKSIIKKEFNGTLILGKDEEEIFF
ncbi:MAG: MBL fold metallo-hydrolase [Candidatus Helarchaeota archaeon]